MEIDSRRYLRQIMCEKRGLISNENAVVASKIITERLLNLPILKNCQHIAAYLSHAGEIDTTFLIEQLHKLGKKCYLPVLDKNKPYHLRFANYLPEGLLTRNRYQILEPTISESNECLPNLLDMVLVPLVAFDKQKNRLGMGGGYYDRTFAFTKKLMTHQPLLIGLAYEFQCVNQLKAESWDVPLQLVITEKNII